METQRARRQLIVSAGTLALLLLAFVATIVFFTAGGSGEGTVADLRITPENDAGSSESEVGTENSVTIIAFGDSITAGYGLLLDEAYPALLERLLRDTGYRAVVVNAGISGETTAGGLRRAEFIAKQKPDIVILALGGNDVLRGIAPSSTRENLASILAIFQQAKIKVLLAGMSAPSNLGTEYAEAFNAIYPDLARAYDVPLVPFLLANVALDKSKNQADGIHPNEEGVRIIAEENILPRLLPLLKK